MLNIVCIVLNEFNESIAFEKNKYKKLIEIITNIKKQENISYFKTNSTPIFYWFVTYQFTSRTSLNFICLFQHDKTNKQMTLVFISDELKLQFLRFGSNKWIS